MNNLIKTPSNPLGKKGGQKKGRKLSGRATRGLIKTPARTMGKH